MTRRFFGPLALASLALLAGAGGAAADDWIHWRGPEQTGHARDTGLPDTWEPYEAGRDNLVWKAPVGYRSTPVIMGGKMYVIAAAGDVPRVQTQAEKLVTGERIVCMDANTGKVQWERRFPVFLTDIVVTRLGLGPDDGRPGDQADLRPHDGRVPRLPGRGDGQDGVGAPVDGGVRAGVRVRRAGGRADLRLRAGDRRHGPGVVGPVRPRGLPVRRLRQGHREGGLVGGDAVRPARHLLLEPGGGRHQRRAADHLRRGRRGPARLPGPDRQAGLELPVRGRGH